MTGAALFSSFSLRRRAQSRLRLALAVSVAGHLLLALGMATEPLSGKRDSEETVSLTVRLLPQPATEAVGPALLEPEPPIAARRTRRPAPIPDREWRAVTAEAGARPVVEAPPLALPEVPDPTYYGARDLDDYPRPVTPLALDRITAGDSAPVRVAVALQIDEQGNVNNVEFPELAAPDRLKEELRAVLATTRFLPARKDGRAVKSHVLLSISFAAAGATVSH